LETRGDGQWGELASLLAASGGTVAGVSVGPQTALRCAPAFACIRAIGETIETVPLHLHRRLPDGGRERVTDHPAARVLRGPCEFMTTSEFKLTLGMHLATHGNFFAWIGRNVAGDPVELIPLGHGRVSVKTDDSTMAPVYTLSTASGQRTLDRAELLHVRGPGLDPYKGDSPTELAREPIALALVLEKYAAGLFGRGARPAGVLKMGGRITNEATLARLRSGFESLYRGGDNAGRVAILEDGTEWVPMQMSSTDAQFLELRRLQIQEISRYWRVPLSMIGDLERATWSNCEALALQFIQFTMLPLFKSIADALALSLLRPEERDDYFFDWVVDDFVKADLAARMQAYATAVSHGIMSPDECRALDNRGPVPDGSGAIFTRPVNAAPVSDSPAPSGQGGAANG